VDFSKKLEGEVLCLRERGILIESHSKGLRSTISTTRKKVKAFGNAPLYPGEGAPLHSTKVKDDVLRRVLFRKISERGWETRFL